MADKGYSPEWLSELKSRNDIVSVVSRYIKLDRKGKNHWGVCPFHYEKTPSFSVNEVDQYYHCFGCRRDLWCDLGCEEELHHRQSHHDHCISGCVDACVLAWAPSLAPFRAQAGLVPIPGNGKGIPAASQKPCASSHNPWDGIRGNCCQDDQVLYA